MATTPTVYEKVKKQSLKKKLENGLFEEFRLYGLPMPMRQYQFHPTRKWSADFAWLELKIIVEVQGGLFIPKGAGGHNRGAQMEKDYEKWDEATRLGWRVFMFGPKALYRPKRTQESSKALEFLYPILKGEKPNVESPKPPAVLFDLQ